MCIGSLWGGRRSYMCAITPEGDFVATGTISITKALIWGKLRLFCFKGQSPVISLVGSWPSTCGQTQARSPFHMCVSVCARVSVSGMPLSHVLCVCNIPFTCGVCVSVCVYVWVCRECPFHVWVCQECPLHPPHLPGSALLPQAAGGSVHWLIR